MNSKDIKYILNFIRKEWYRPFMPILLVVLINFVLFYAYSFMKPVNLFTLHEFGIIFLISLITLPIWFFKTRIPKAPKGHIGFVVAITTENKRQHLLISKDFIRNLRELLAQSTFEYKFEVIEFPEYYSNKIYENQQVVREYLRKSRCHFIIYGNVELRHYQAKETHYLNLEGEVIHSPISKEISQRFSEEFAEIFPRKLFLSAENDLLEFVVTSEWVSFVAQYIIGIASVLSGDINYAQSLFEDLDKKIPRNTSIAAIQKIIKKLPKRLFDVYMTQAKFTYQDWRKTHSPELIEKLKYFLDKTRATNIDNYGLRVTYALYSFISKRDIASAKKELRKAKKFKEKDQIWLLNLAFLFAYEGNMKSALEHYQKAAKYDHKPNILIEVEEFILWVLKNEHQKIQLYFCLGFINMVFKNDKTVAQKDFEMFLEQSSEEGFSETRRMARDYIEELK